MLTLMHATAKSRQTSLSQEILALLLQHSLSPGSSLLSYAHHVNRIDHFILRNQPIKLVLPAFPAKSPNPEKTFGALPDLAEVLGLQRLQETCERISQIYSPGAQVVICSDGRVFSDLVLVSDENVSAYGYAIREIIKEFKLSALTSFDMDHIFPHRDYESMRASLVSEYARPMATIREEILEKAESRAMFNGIHRFIFEDRLVLQPEKSRNRLREESKEVAYQVIQRSNAWSSLVEKKFPESIRLSIHPQFSASPKLGFQLVTCSNAWGTPWHNVALKGSNGFRLQKRKDAEAANAVLTFFKGKYAYYQERDQ